MRNLFAFALLAFAVAAPLSSSADTHAYVDLGLPSGTLWATCNVGADAPEEYGDYFAWGEVEPKDVYDWSTYQWCNGGGYSMTKYCTDGNYGNEGFVDNKIELDPEDDAATANWGPDWSTPTEEQVQELIANCTTEWATINGVNGRLFTSNINGASLFLPAAGVRIDDGLNIVGVFGYYWSNALNANTPYYGYFFYINNSSTIGWFGSFRFYGMSVRPVRMTQEPSTGVSDVTVDKAVASVRYYNLAGQEVAQPSGVTIQVVTRTDGSMQVVKVMK